MDALKDLKTRTDCRQVLAQDLGDPARKSGEAWQWRCVFHHDRTPSLTAWPDAWKCFGCGRAGDAVDWLRERQGLTFRQAVQALGGEGKAPAKPKPPAAPLREPPTPAWQEQAWQVVQEAHACLLSDKGEKARGWLAKRGIGEADLDLWHLGYIPADRRERWGDVAVFLPRGIVIPCLAGDAVWYVKVRRPVGEPKYILAKGSRPALYGTPGGHRELLLTEGEFDCILMHRLVGDVLDVGTFGSAAVRDVRPWLGALVRYSVIYLGLDNDDAGREAQAAWLSLTQRAKVLSVPGGKDWSDGWLALGDAALREYTLAHLWPGGDLPLYCACGEPVWAYSPDGQPLCEAHARAAGIREVAWDG